MGAVEAAENQQEGSLTSKETGTKRGVAAPPAQWPSAPRDRPQGTVQVIPAVGFLGAK